MPNCEHCNTPNATGSTLADSGIMHYFCNTRCGEKWVNNMLSDYNRLSQVCRENNIDPIAAIKKVREEDGVKVDAKKKQPRIYIIKLVLNDKIESQKVFDGVEKLLFDLGQIGTLSMSTVIEK